MPVVKYEGPGTDSQVRVPVGMKVPYAQCLRIRIRNFWIRYPPQEGKSPDTGFIESGSGSRPLANPNLGTDPAESRTAMLSYTLI